MHARYRVSMLLCWLFAVCLLLPTAARATDLDSTLAFDIPAQDLPAALVLFAQQSNIQVIAASKDLGTHRIEAVHGQFKVRDLLLQMLSGTGLTFTEEGNGTVTISRAAAQSTHEAPNFEGNQQEVTVFGRGIAETVKDVPQTVSVFNAPFIENVKATIADDVVRFTPNAVPYGWAVPLYTAVTMRGFNTSLTWNGMAYRSINGTFKLANVERVEVLKGPASVLYGSMEPGAVINLVTKRPQQQFEASGDISYGRFNEQHYDLDIGGPLTDRIGMRLNAAYFKTDTPFENTGVHDLFVAPVIEFKLSDSTLLTLDSFYDKADWPRGYTDGRVPVLGGLIPNPVGKIPLQANFQYDENITGPDGVDHLRHPQTDVDANARLSHNFTENLSLNIALSYHDSQYDREQLFTGGLAADNRTLSRFYLYDKGYEAKADIAHAILQWQGTTGVIKHNAAFGVDYTHTDYHLQTAYMNVSPIDIFAPVYGTIVLPNPIPFDAEDGKTNVSEAYVQDRATLGDFHLLAGGRYSAFRSADNYQAYQSDLTRTGINDSIWSTQFGALYDLPGGVTLFASRNESFVPRLATIFGQGLTAQPERGIQYEVGAKFDLGHSGLTGNVTFFNIDKKHLLVADEDHVGFDKPVGAVNSKGIEVSVEGSPLPGTSIYLGYGYNPTKITEADTNVGHSFFNVPKQTFSAYVNYEVREGLVRGLSVTSSLQYVGERWASDDDIYLWPSYTRVDLGATYPATDHLKIGVNVQNLLESTIYSGFGGSRVTRNPFRTVMGTIAYRY